MNTNHTTRNAMRTGVLTAVLTGLLLGAPATAFADTSNPAPTRPTLHNNTVIAEHPTSPAAGVSQSLRTPRQIATAPADPIVDPKLTGSTSGQTLPPTPPIPLLIYGAGFTPNGAVNVEVRDISNGNLLGESYTTIAAPGTYGGSIQLTTHLLTTTLLLGNNAFAIATDVTTGKQTQKQGVMIANP
jgi:hypothetical protein